MADAYIFLILGVASISATVVYIYMGKVWLCFPGWVYRAERPIRFWCYAATYYLIGFLLIAFYFLRVHALS